MSACRSRAGLVAGALALLLATAAATPPGATAHPPEPEGLAGRFDRLSPRVAHKLELTAERIAARAAARAAAQAAAPDPFEDATIRVTTLEDTVADDGACSLREAILAARFTDEFVDPGAPGDCGPVDSWGYAVITFDVGGTIELTAELPLVMDWLTIDASEAPEPVVIDGGGAHRALRIDSEAWLDLYDITLVGGRSATTGGAILNHGFLAADGLTITSSRAELAGGGINATAGSVTWLTSSTISGNSTGGAGGGIRSAGFLVLLDGIVSDNTAASGGGIAGLAVGRGDATIVEFATLSGNQATDPAAGGGAIDSRGMLGLVNVTLAGNTAARGGAIRDRGSAIVYFTTITGNTADTGAGLASTATPYLDSTLVLGNTGGGAQVDATLDPDSLANLVELPAGLALDDVLDPAGLADNGGTTPTVALVRSADNPARGTADPVVCPDLPLDQRWFERTGPCDIGAYEIDDVAPTVRQPLPGLVARGRLDGATLDGLVTWTAVDTGSGIATQELEASVDGGAWAPLAVAPDAGELAVAYAAGSTYRFRARAADADGNVSEWVTGPLVTAALVQQGADAVELSRGWTLASGDRFSGGSARYAEAAGAWVKLRATGRTYAFVTSTGPDRGKAKVYVDGIYVTTIDLRSPVPRSQVQAWTKTFAHAKARTIKIVLLGTGSHPRVDADAFAVLR